MKKKTILTMTSRARPETKATCGNRAERNNKCSCQKPPVDSFTVVRVVMSLA